MVSRNHPEDEVLESFAGNPASVPQDVAEHIANCKRCTGRVAFHHKAAALVADGTATSQRRTRKAGDVMQFRRRIAHEDAEADRLLVDVLNSPYGFVGASLLRQRRFYTGGVVRKLTAAAREWTFKDAEYALQLAKTATFIADSLPDDHYPSLAIADLRGDAWKERGNVCWSMGAYEAGLEAAASAEAAYSDKYPADSIQLATVAVLRASILSKQKKFADALRLIRRALSIFLDARQTRRYLEATEAEAIILARMGRVKFARTAFLNTFQMADAHNALDMKARSAKNIAVIAREAGDLGIASEYALIAVQLYDELGWTSQALRARWLIHQIALTAGKFRDVIEPLRRIEEEFERCGSYEDAADVRLDIAEALIMTDQLEEAEAICLDLVLYYRQQNVVTDALTAVSFLREIVAKRAVKRHDVQYVRRFLAERRDDPSLIFVAPAAP